MAKDEKNGFFGKKHSHEARQKISASLKGKPSKRRKLVCVEFRIYNSLKGASLVTGLNASTILYRIRKGRPGYYYLDPLEKFSVSI